MQIAMGAIFVGCLGLAALVTHERRAGASSQLAGIRYVGDTGIRLPAGWILQREKQGFILFVAKEPGDAEHEGRTIIIRRQKVDPATKADEYLTQSGLLADTRAYHSEDQTSYTAEPLTVAKAEGIVLAVERPEGFLLLAPPNFVPEWIACSVRPSGVAITLQLVCPDMIRPDEDKELLRDIAAAIEVKD